MRNMHMAWSLALGLSLASCVPGRHPVGPNYTRPVITAAPFHNLDAAKSVKTGLPSPPLDAWWTGFDDPMLVTVVQRALQQNLDLAAAFDRVTQARAAAAEAGAHLLPIADLNAAVTTQRQSTANQFGAIGSSFPGYSRNLREYTVGPAASWEIDLAGGLRRGKAAALYELQAAEADHVGTRITVAAESADAYVQVREFQARIAVAQQLIDTDAGLLRLVEARRRAGAADGREVAQAEALLKQARTTVPPLRVRLEAQLNRLDVLMGVQPGTYAKELMTPGKIPEVPAIGDADQPLDVLRRRPDITVSQSFDLPAFLAGRFPGLTLDGGLFYRWPIGIRFELGGRGPEPMIMALVRHRAVSLYDGNFGPEDSCVVIAQDWSAEFLPQQPLFAFARSQNIGLRNDPQHLDIERQTDDGELDRHTLQWVEQAARSFDYGAIFQAIGNADHAIEPSVGSRVYFCNARTDVILHMYDDRGLDVIASQPEVLVPLYRTFNQWILDYDREQIDRLFSALAG